MEEVSPLKKVKTRKSHVCFGCNRKFEKGTEMYTQTLKEDDIYTLHTCETCQTLFNEYNELFEDVSEGVLHEQCVVDLCSEMNVKTPEDLIKKLKSEAE